MVLGIALGVAVVVSIDIANASASQAFDLSTQAITGKATHYITGGPSGLDDEVYVDLRNAGLDVAAAPVVAAYVASPQIGGIPLQLLGVDPFVESRFRNYLVGEQGVPVEQLTPFLAQPGAILLSENLAARHELVVGDEFNLEVGGQNKLVFVAGLLTPEDNLSRRALNGILVADIATAQELTGRVGRLDRVDLILPENKGDLQDQIEAILPKGTQVLRVEARSGTVQQMTAAFRTNLTALSLLALVVGLFLIYNTMTFSVVQRRAMFGRLRCLGVTRREIFTMVESEALLVGVLGSGLGVLLGILLGRGAVQLVTQTIDDLFFVVTVRDVGLSTFSLIKGAALGIVATTVAAAAPAWEAASVPPRAALLRSGLESKVGKIIHWAAIAGVALSGAGLGALLIPTNDLVVSFGATFAVVIGFAMLTPFVTTVLMRWAAQPVERVAGVLGRMAPREVVNSISRTSIAVAALMVAVSVSIGVSLMVNSFRFTVELWMNQILQGDIYVSVPGATLSQPILTIEPDVLEMMREWPGVARVDVLRSATVDSPAGPIMVNATDNRDDWQENLYLSTKGTPAEAWQAVLDGAVLISEPLANRLGIPYQGGTITLTTAEGQKSFEVVGVYYDYTSTQGNLLMWLDNYRQLWGDNEITAASIRLAERQDVDQVVAALQAVLTPVQRLSIRANSALRAETLEVFDRTFAITGALQVLVTLVAFIGVLSATLSLQLEKQRQLGILKAIGLTARQVWGLVTLETGLMGSVAGFLAMPTGFVLSLILIYIINRRSFGWTLQLQLIPDPFWQALIVAVTASLLAGLYPAWRISQRNPAEAIRFD